MSGGGDGKAFKIERNDVIGRGALGAWQGFLQRGHQQHLEIQRGVQERIREQMHQRELKERSEKTMKEHNDYWVSKGYPHAGPWKNE